MKTILKNYQRGLAPAGPMDVSPAPLFKGSKDTHKDIVVGGGRSGKRGGGGGGRASRKHFSRLPRIVRTPPATPVTQHHRISIKECYDDSNGNAPKAGSNRGYDSVSEAAKLKQSYIPRLRSPLNKDSVRQETSPDKINWNAKQTQRVQMVNINQDYPVNGQPDSKSLAIAKPIPSLSPVIKRLNNSENRGLREWYVNPDIDEYMNVPVNSFVDNGQTIVEIASRDSGDTRPSITDVDILNSDQGNHRLPGLAIASEPFAAYKTTDDNVNDWLAAETQNRDAGRLTVIYFLQGNTNFNHRLGCPFANLNYPRIELSISDCNLNRNIMLENRGCVIRDVRSGEPQSSMVVQMENAGSSCKGKVKSPILTNGPIIKSEENKTQNEDLNIKSRSSIEFSTSSKIKDDILKIGEVNRLSKSKVEVSKTALASEKKSLNIKSNNRPLNRCEENISNKDVEKTPVNKIKEYSSFKSKIEHFFNRPTANQPFKKFPVFDSTDTSITDETSTNNTSLDHIMKTAEEIQLARMNRIPFEPSMISKFTTTMEMQTHSTETEKTTSSKASKRDSSNKILKPLINKLDISKWVTKTSSMDNRSHKHKVEQETAAKSKSEMCPPKKKRGQDDDESDKDTVVGTDFGGTLESGTSSSCFGQSNRPITTPSYVDCPSEVLQRTTNFETAVYISDHRNGNVGTGTGAASQKTDSIAATDLEVREDLSQFTLEQMEYLDNQSECIECHHTASGSRNSPIPSNSHLTYEVRQSDTCISDAWSYPYYVERHDKRKKVTPISSHVTSPSFRKAYMSRYSKLNVESASVLRKRRTKSLRYRNYRFLQDNSQIRQETFYEFYTRYRDFTQLRPQFFKMCRVCRHRLNSIWKKSKRWNLRNKNRLNCRGYETMAYVQRAMVWENVDIQTSLVVFCETSTVTEKDQRTLAITTSLRLSSWLAGYNKMHTESTSTNSSDMTKYASRGPSMFPLLKNNFTSTTTKEFIQSTAALGFQTSNQLENIQDSCQSFPAAGRLSWLNNQPIISKNRCRSCFKDAFINSQRESPAIRTLNSTPAQWLPEFKKLSLEKPSLIEYDASACCSIDEDKMFKSEQAICTEPTSIFNFTKARLQDCNTGTDDLVPDDSIYLNCMNYINDCVQSHSEAQTQYDISHRSSVSLTDTKIKTLLKYKITDTASTLNLKSTLDMALRSLAKSFKKSSSIVNLSRRNSPKQVTVVPLTRKFSVVTQTDRMKTSNSTYTNTSHHEVTKKDSAIVTEPKKAYLSVTDVKVISIPSLLPNKDTDPPNTKSDVNGCKETTAFPMTKTWDNLLNREILVLTKKTTAVGSKELTKTHCIAIDTSEGGCIIESVKKDKSIGDGRIPYTAESHVQYLIEDLPFMSDNTLVPMGNSASITAQSTTSRQTTYNNQAQLCSEYKKTHSQSIQYMTYEEDIVEEPPKPTLCSTSVGASVSLESRGLSAVDVSQPHRSIHVQFSPHLAAEVEVATDEAEMKSDGEMTTRSNLGDDGRVDNSVQYSTRLISPERSEKIGLSQLMSVFTLCGTSCRDMGTQLRPSYDQETNTKPEDVDASTIVLDLQGQQSETTFTSVSHLEENTENTLVSYGEKLLGSELLECVDRVQANVSVDLSKESTVFPLPPLLNSFPTTRKTQSSPAPIPDLQTLQLDDNLNSLAHLDHQLICLSRLMGRQRWSPCEYRESSSLSPDKWMRRCGINMEHDASKEYQSLLELQKATLATLDASLNQARCTNESTCERQNLNQLKHLKQTDADCVPELFDPLTIVSRDSLADVLPIRAPSKVTVALSSVGAKPPTMLDKITSDEKPTKELREYNIQAAPDKRDAATNVDPKEVKTCKSAGEFTSRVILPPGFCVGKDGPRQDCVFVYDHPRCVVHNTSVADACIQQDPSQRDVELDTGKEHAIDEDLGLTSRSVTVTSSAPRTRHGSDKTRLPSVVLINDVLSPRVYKALYETTKLVAKSLPRRHSSNRSNRTHSTPGTTSTDQERASDSSSPVSAPEKTSAEILTSRVNYDNKGPGANPSTGSDSSPSAFSAVTTPFHYEPGLKGSISTSPDSTPTFDRERSTGPQWRLTQYCSGCRGHADVTRDKSQKGCGSIEECVRTQLMACQYYSNMLTQHVQRVTDKLEDPSSNEKSDIKYLDPSCKSNEDHRPMKTVEKKSNGEKDLKPSLSHALSAMDIGGKDKKQLKNVYYLLTAIEGRIRRLRSNLPN